MLVQVKILAVTLLTGKNLVSLVQHVLHPLSEQNLAFKIFLGGHCLRRVIPRMIVL